MFASLRVLQWNCRSLLNKIDFLTGYLYDGNDVLCLQSTNCPMGGLPRLDGYYSGMKEGHDKKGGKVMKVSGEATKAPQALC